MKIRPMTRSLALAALLAAATACDPFTGPGGDSGKPLKSLPRELSAAERSVLSGSNRFAFGLLREVARADTASNVFVSPLSASMALGMAMNGARSGTLDEMRATLGFGELPPADVNASYRGLIDLLRGLDRGVEMRVANSVWARQGFPFHAEFMQTGKQYFDAEVSTLDFDDPGAPATINGWVSRSTGGKIRTIVDGPIPTDAVAYLINAIYFKGAWTHAFDRRRTRDAPFLRADGTQQTVKMMHGSGKVAHLSTPEIEAVDLPYGRGAFSMTVVLPRPGTRVDDLVAGLNAERWQAWMEQLTERQLDVYLPRFRLEYEKTLNHPLQGLGMRAAFQPHAADFSGMSPRALYVSNVKQKTFVEVNEEGTEAAAATSVEMRAVSMPPFVMVNRPFLVVIRERLSGTILFIGKIGAPPSA